MLRWKFFDHAAHLGGYFGGYVYWNYLCRKYGTCTYNNNNNNNKDDNTPCRLVFGQGKYVFEGEYVNFKPRHNYGIIYSPRKTYFGEIDSNFFLDGKGCLHPDLLSRHGELSFIFFIATLLFHIHYSTEHICMHKYIYTYIYNNNKPVGLGIQETLDGWCPSRFDGKFFYNTMEFKPSELGQFFDESIDVSIFTTQEDPKGTEHIEPSQQNENVQDQSVQNESVQK
ncbi:hypothetical protein RFI_23247 [Reticulomyxa filosa]|uniref:Uncharacterized protein n=1 Tax=Reticulomyxa filosa TaxID=46433 RepID=X6MJS6_RETFI|nr:hypothetical protein RFI_23247 [Reticulomyxa filosa]|eukprot:ETO14119.1 hypothetical protein RFI_23247 [Reticulomyxa filosa]